MTHLAVYRQGLLPRSHARARVTESCGPAHGTLLGPASMGPPPRVDRLRARLAAAAPRRAAQARRPRDLLSLGRVASQPRSALPVAVVRRTPSNERLAVRATVRDWNSSMRSSSLWGSN